MVIVQVLPGLVEHRAPDGTLVAATRPYVSIEEMHRLGITWKQIDSLLGSSNASVRELGFGLLMGRPREVHEWLGVPY